MLLSKKEMGEQYAQYYSIYLLYDMHFYSFLHYLTFIATGNILQCLKTNKKLR